MSTYTLTHKHTHMHTFKHRAVPFKMLKWAIEHYMTVLNFSYENKYNCRTRKSKSVLNKTWTQSMNCTKVRIPSLHDPSLGWECNRLGTPMAVITQINIEGNHISAVAWDLSRSKFLTRSDR